jgi:RNA polymerase sigma-70 factor (ECF subfamily)
VSDAELVARAQQGDESAFEKLVRRHQRYAFNVAYRALGDTAEAEDVTQEAFVRAWRGLPAFRSQARFTTWLYRIVYNLCLNRLPGLQQELFQAEPMEEALVSSAPSPLQLVETRERVAFLHTQLDQLPAKYRLVLTLRYLQNLSYEEIATALDVPMGTVKTHIHRARRSLADQVRQWEEQTAASENGADVPDKARRAPSSGNRSVTYALP